VNEASTTKNQPVLQTWLRKFNYPLVDDEVSRHGIVHRLDKETSGVMLIAKTKEAFDKLQAEFKSREVQKTYIALTSWSRLSKMAKLKFLLDVFLGGVTDLELLPAAETPFRNIKLLNFTPGKMGDTLWSNFRQKPAELTKSGFMPNILNTQLLPMNFMPAGKPRGMTVSGVQGFFCTPPQSNLSIR
jgi:hypothetical protein